MSPVRYRPERGTGRKNVRCREHRHQGDKPTIAAIVDSDVLRIHAQPVCKVLCAVDLILKILVTDVSIDCRPPIASVTCAAAVIDIEVNVVVIDKVIVEHLL